MPVTTRSTGSRNASPDVQAGSQGSKSPASSRAGSPNNGAVSKDQEARERPVRKKFEKTHIDTAGEVATTTATTNLEEVVDDAGSEAASVEASSEKDDATLVNGERGRLRKKRSFEEHRGEEEANDTKEDSTSASKRKRSRDTKQEADVEGENTDTLLEATVTKDEPLRPQTPPIPDATRTEKATEPPLSPQNKRTRDQFAADQSQSLDQSLKETEHVDGSTSAPGTETEVTKEPESKRPRDDVVSGEHNGLGLKHDSKAIGGGFANTSTQSPFGTLGENQQPNSLPQTSPKKFASSGFASLATSSQSPFGQLGGASKVEDSKEPGKSTFTSFSGGTASPFASAGKPALGSPSGFGKLGSSTFGSSSGFGSLGGGASLTSFASSAKPPPGGALGKPAASFGAPADEDDDEGSGDEVEEAEAAKFDAEEEKKDPRFFEQDVETGEEEEENVFSCRGKLYISIDKQWKERGIGTFKINAKIADNAGSVPTADDEPDTRKVETARFLMRADGSHRLALNSPLQKAVKVEDPAGGPPKGKSAVFIGWVDGKMHLLQLKVRSAELAHELYSAVRTIQGKLSDV